MKNYDDWVLLTKVKHIVIQYLIVIIQFTLLAFSLGISPHFFIYPVLKPVGV